MLGINIGKTIWNGVKRAFRVNVTEWTEDDEVSDALAKAIKIGTRLVVLIVLARVFPEEFQTLFELIIP